MSNGDFALESVVLMKRHLENEAIEALRKTLGQISVIKIKEIKVESTGRAEKERSLPMSRSTGTLTDLSASW